MQERKICPSFADPVQIKRSRLRVHGETSMGKGEREL